MKFKLLVNWKTKCYLITTMLLLSIGVIQSQSLTLKGTVSGDGNPLPGVSVIIKGSNSGTTTDFDGLFEIKANTSDVLVFSYMGFKTKEVTIGTTTNLNITLVSDVAALNEVVVVGYGTQRKKEVTGAVINVGEEVIAKTATSDLATALQGQVAGVNIQAASGRPGAAANVQIRGLGSVSSGSLGPLYVVDGIPFEGNPNIAPEQVKSIDILKDGAAASIYGTRASNGVILITTKKGSKGKMKIDFSAYTGIQNITSGTPLMNAEQQMYTEEVLLEALGRDPLIFFFNQDALDYNSDFVGDVQNNNALIQNYNLSLSGGVENLTLNFNTGYFKQDGVLINSGFNRFTNRITGEFKKGKFKAYATLGFTEENRDQEPWGLYEYAITQKPWQPPLADLASIGDNGVQIPVRNAEQYGYLSKQLGNTDETTVKSSNIAVNLSYEILEGLNYKISLGRNSWDSERNFFQKQYLIYNRDGSYNAGASNEKASLNKDYFWSTKQSIENIVNYNKEFGKHKVGLLAVLSYEKYNSETLGTGVIYSKESGNSLEIISGGSEGITPNGIEEERTLSGKLFRAQYNYDDRYLLSASIRRDGSSKFSEENRYGNFKGFSAGWNIHEEQFFENLKWEKLNSVKLRASWAEVGNQDIPSYSFSPVIESGINYPYGPNESLNFGAIQRRYVDPNIKWETTISKNIGIDITMLDYRLNFTADLYQNDKEDMLLQERLPPSTGTYQPRATGVYDVKTINAGNMVNKGIELALSYKDETASGLKYNISSTFTKNKNKVTDLNGIERGYANARPIVTNGENTDYTTFLAEGYEAGAFFLVEHAGVIKNDEQLAAYQLIDGSAQKGDMMYVDQDGNNKIDDNDRVYAGSGQAEFEAGISVNLEYKNFDFFVQGYYSYGAEIYNGAKLHAYSRGRHADQYYMWSPQNPDSDIPTDRLNSLHNNVRARSDYFIEDGTYFRIRNLSLGYTIPNLVEKTGIEKARVYITGVNPFTFTNYDGYDPEVGGDGIFTRGVDRGNYPVTRQFMLGVQLSF
ncbi:TonB-linked outer membrane protein, SusC/RagA family [Lutibacter oricola]|uniref:TonB-linked outer membrane protein, SusC/RagA family n=1 Tax=Lutibacter oricola TaxID=762486 RepID=A0A1H3E0M3_9FLAO|nr:TonB-dependent receptor [Lutibacter oricola]SDX72206.1 TonB-linked outer membrane protein, SusC/RagA family [Lutibacter oricola]